MAIPIQPSGTRQEIKQIIKNAGNIVEKSNELTSAKNAVVDAKKAIKNALGDKYQLNRSQRTKLAKVISALSQRITMEIRNPGIHGSAAAYTQKLSPNHAESRLAENSQPQAAASADQPAAIKVTDFRAAQGKIRIDAILAGMGDAIQNAAGLYKDYQAAVAKGDEYADDGKFNKLNPNAEFERFESVIANIVKETGAAYPTEELAHYKQLAQDSIDDSSDVSVKSAPRTSPPAEAKPDSEAVVVKNAQPQRAAATNNRPTDYTSLAAGEERMNSLFEEAEDRIVSQADLLNKQLDDVKEYSGNTQQTALGNLDKGWVTSHPMNSFQRIEAMARRIETQTGFKVPEDKLASLKAAAQAQCDRLGITYNPNELEFAG